MRALVILGHRLLDDGSISETLKKRLNRALTAVDQIKPDVIIVSGGIANAIAGISEAQRMFQYLTEHGIPQEKIMLEEKSQSTAENAKYSAPILKSLGVREVYVLSSSEHLRRTFLNPIRLFKSQLKDSNMEVYPFC